MICLILICYERAGWSLRLLQLRLCRRERTRLPQPKLPPLLIPRLIRHGRRSEMSHPRLRRQLAVPDISMFCLAAKRNIDRYANKSSLDPAAGGARMCCPKQARYQLRYTKQARGVIRQSFTVPVACYVTGTIIIIQTLLKSQGVYDDLRRKDSEICSVKTL